MKIFRLLLPAVVAMALTDCASDTPGPPPPIDAPPVAAPTPPVAPPATRDTSVPQEKPAEPVPGIEKDAHQRAGKGAAKSGSDDLTTENSGAPPLPTGRTTAPPALGGKESSIAKNGFSELTALDASIPLDIRYATANNFTKSKIYDCPRCLLRPEAAKALVLAQKALQKKDLSLKMFDCYRPGPYQQRLWDKVPNPDYVTPPSKGSMHSRGAAVDLTIVDKNGKELDMGTPYDFFGVEAHTDNMKLPARVLANRRLLAETLEAVGFKGIRTEWWHFSYQKKNYPLSEFVWPCE